MIAATDVYGPCRACGEPAFLRDDQGPAHPCCILSGATSPRTCPACTSSRAYWKQGGNFYSKKYRAEEATRARKPERKR